ncbi:MAG: peptidylglycine alpha-amidating monooxygenase [Polyangiaceae bacterium]
MLTRMSGGFWSAIMIAFAAWLVACGDSTGLSELGKEADVRSETSFDAGGASRSGGNGSGDDGPQSTPIAGTANGLPCAVRKVLEDRCGDCHGAKPSAGAPNTLLSFDDLMVAAGSSKTWERVKARIVDDRSPMPPPPGARLSATELATMNAWFDGRKERSTETCTTASTTGAAEKLPCTPDRTLKPQKAWTMSTTSPDQYVCFGFDVTVPKKRHITALAPKVDNTTILHHILLFQASSSYGSETKECSPAGSADWRLVSGWAPGGKYQVLPDEAGFPEEGTVHYVIQLHYNNVKALPNQTDQTGFDFCTTETLRKYDADVLAFGGMGFTIPPRASLKYQCDYTLDQNFKGVKIFGATPHMHKMGTAISSVRVPNGGLGTPEKIVDEPAYNYQNQATYPAANEVNPGDVIRTTCSWNNTSDKKMTFGEGTDDEMCFTFLTYYPKITQFPSWVTPSLVPSLFGCKNL